ncbi:MAG: DUF6502 family protein [Woeseiaceae bacterium]|nr:DUF6502 family protein [Woeseiaceae bacterium]
MSQSVKESLSRAIALMLKPLIRLLMAQGITHADFSEVAKEVYVETAIRHFEESGTINKSRIAILTGLTRKEVKSVIDRTLEASPTRKRTSRPERVLTGWYSDPKYTGPYGIPLELPYEGVESDGKTFVNLVREYSGDMAPRQMLNELMTSGAVIEVEGRYKAVRRDYNFSALSPEFITRLGEVGYRVFSTAAKNIDKEMEGSGYFDRMVFADDGCTDDVIKRFDAYIKVKGQALLEEIDVWFSTNSVPDDTAEIKDTGVYMVHYVETADERKSLRDVLEDRLGTSKR